MRADAPRADPRRGRALPARAAVCERRASRAAEARSKPLSCRTCGDLSGLTSTAREDGSAFIETGHVRTGKGHHEADLEGHLTNAWRVQARHHHKHKKHHKRHDDDDDEVTDDEEWSGFAWSLLLALVGVFADQDRKSHRHRRREAEEP